MKRIVAVGAIVVVLLAAGWSLFWWLGRGALERAVDAEVARLEAAGWRIGWADRRIGGFPFGYTIRLTGLEAAEPASGFAVRLPHATVENDGTEGVLVRLPETFAADLPLATPGNAGAPEQPAVAAATGEAQALVVRLAGAGVAGAERRVGVMAQSLTWRLRMPESPREQVLTFEGLAADMVSGGAETTLALKAARYGVEAALAEGDGSPSTMTASYRNVNVTGDTTVPTLGALAEMLYAGAPGQFDLAVQAGPAEAHLVGGGEEQRGTLDWQAGAISGVATLSSGRIELDGEARQNFWTLTPEDADAPFRGRVGAETLAATYAMPMAPAGQPDDMAIRLSLAEVTLDDAAWAAIDPNGALPREPARLNVDLGGRARVTRRIDGLSPGDAPPFEVSLLDVHEITIEALGASARATGQIEFLQPIGLPLGTLEVSMSGVSALIGALGRAGVLPRETVDMADAMLTVYARPAEGKDQWETDIAFTNDGPRVNGRPIQ